MPDEAVSLALAIEPGAVAPLLRGLGIRAGRPVPLEMTWHDTADARFARDGTVLLAWRRGRREGWRLQSVMPSPLSPRGNAGDILAEGAGPEVLGIVAPEEIAAFCTFVGRQRTAHAGAVRLIIEDGALKSGIREVALCRVRLDGSAADIAALGLMHGEVAGETIAAMALRLAGHDVVPSLPALPPLHDGMTASDGLAAICAYFGERLRLIAPAAAEGAGPEPVHQMRVTVRRARSALKLFHRAVPCDELDVIAAGLRALGQALGPARDWDVFLGSTISSVAAVAGPRMSARLAAAARRRQRAGYEALRAYLAGDAFRRLGLLMALAVLDRPWQRSSDADALALPLADFAAAALSRRWRRLRAPGRDLADLPDERLHAIRLDAKRMRYAVELFAPLHERRAAERMAGRMAQLQERLGLLNDGVVAAGLLAELGAAGHGFAGGVARGLAVARAEGTHVGIGKTWRRARRSKPFWR